MHRFADTHTTVSTNTRIVFSSKKNSLSQHDTYYNQVENVCLSLVDSFAAQVTSVRANAQEANVG